MEEGSALVSALCSLSDGDRAAVEPGLVSLARAAALGEITADFAHDVANSIFGILGLTDLLLDDIAPGSEDEERLRQLRQTAVDLKGSLKTLLEFARPVESAAGPGDLVQAVRSALAIARHGVGLLLQVEERYPAGPQLVACPVHLAAEAALHLILAARTAGGPITVTVAGGALSVSPPGAESLGVLAASRIAAGYGGGLDRTADAATLTFRD